MPRAVILGRGIKNLYQINLKEWFIIVKISQEEAFKIRKKFPGAYITVTNRYAPSRKKTYYVTESYKVMRFLARLRHEPWR